MTLTSIVLKTSCSFLLFLAFLSSFAQKFAPENSIWHYNTEACNISPPGENYCPYYTLNPIKDTTVDGISAQVFIRTDIDANGSTVSQRHVMYGDSLHIYRYDPIQEEFYLHYDFTLQPGESLNIQSAGQDRGLGAAGSAFEIVIDSLDTILIDGIERIVQYTSPASLSDLGYGPENGTAISGIGSAYAFFFAYTAMNSASLGGLRCYKDISTNYTISTSCIPTQLSVENPSQAAFSISPNPASGYVSIVGISSPRPYIIYNLKGQEITRGILMDHHNIDISDLTKGLYILQVDQQRMKFIKQ